MKKTDDATEKFMTFVNAAYADADPISEDNIPHAKLSRNAAAVMIGAEPWKLPALPAEEQALLYSMVSRKTLGELFGLTPSRISQLTSDGVLHPLDGRFLLWQAVIEYAEHVRSRGER